MSREAGYRAYKRRRAWDFNERKGYSGETKGMVLGFSTKILKRSISFFSSSGDVSLDAVACRRPHGPRRTYPLGYNGSKNLA